MKTIKRISFLEAKRCEESRSSIFNANVNCFEGIFVSAAYSGDPERGFVSSNYFGDPERNFVPDVYCGDPERSFVY